MRQDKHRRVERRIRPPPPLPLVIGAEIGPGACLGTELPTAHDLRTEPEVDPLCERVVNTDAAAFLADHRVPEAGGEVPLVEAVAGVAERSVEREALAGAEPVEGDREVVDTDLGHGGLRGAGWAMSSCVTPI